VDLNAFVGGRDRRDAEHTRVERKDWENATLREREVSGLGAAEVESEDVGQCDR